jgi:hypothetical protein
MEWIPLDRRKRGRPRKTWMEGVQAAMTTSNLEPDQWRNRKEWRSLVSGRWRPAVIDIFVNCNWVNTRWQKLHRII